MTIRNLDPSGDLGKVFFQIPSLQTQERSSLSTPGSRPVSRDAVDLSAVAQIFQDFRSRAIQLPAIRADTVGALQQRLANGESLASPEQLANALLREVSRNHGQP